MEKRDVIFLLFVLMLIPMINSAEYGYNILDATTSSTTDTNASTACSGGEVLFGNGSCGIIVGSGGTGDFSFTDFQSSFNSNITVLDFLSSLQLNNTYALIGSGGNSSWNESYANGLYLPHTVIWDTAFNTSFDQRDADTISDFNLVDFQNSFNLNNSVLEYLSSTQLNATYALIGSGGASSWISSSGIIYNDTSGVKVGIGTATPTALLNIKGAGSGDGYILNVSGGNTAYVAVIENTQSSSYASGLLVNVHSSATAANSAGLLNVQESGTSKFLVDADGNVGIGTATPTRLLDVRGAGNFSSTIYINNGTDVSTLGGSGSSPFGIVNGSLIANNTPNVIYGFGTGNPEGFLHLNKTRTAANQVMLTLSEDGTGAFGDNMSILFQMPATGAALRNVAQITALHNAPANNDGNLLFSTGVSGALTEVMRLTDDGFVGIGVPIPSYLFEINSRTNTITQPIFRAFNNGSLRTTLDYTGQQSWNLTSAAHANIGSIGYETPSGAVGITFRMPSGIGRSDFKHLGDNGGFQFVSHSGTGQPTKNILTISNLSYIGFGSLTAPQSEIHMRGTPYVPSSDTLGIMLEKTASAVGATTAMMGFKDSSSNSVTGMLGRQLTSDDDTMGIDLYVHTSTSGAVDSDIGLRIADSGAIYLNPIASGETQVLMPSNGTNDVTGTFLISAGMNPDGGDNIDSNNLVIQTESTKDDSLGSTAGYMHFYPGGGRGIGKDGDVLFNFSKYAKASLWPGSFVVEMNKTTSAVLGGKIELVGETIFPATSHNLPGRTLSFEETSSLNTGTSGGKQWSVGNSAVGINGIPMAANGYVNTLGLICATSGATTGVVQIMVNGTAQGTGCQTSAPGSANGFTFDESCSGVTFERGESVGVITTTTDAATSNCIVDVSVTFTYN